MRNFFAMVGTVLLVILLFILLLPFMLIYFLYKFITMPIAYIKHKTSRYQKDFPHRFALFGSPHIDSKPYNAIKEAELPVQYFKSQKDYDSSGFFVYKNVLLDFNERLSFDRESESWVWTRDEGVSEKGLSDKMTITGAETENIDDSFTVDDLRRSLLDDFNGKSAEYKCDKVIFFYERKQLEKDWGKLALEKTLELDGFVVYEKAELAEAVKEVIQKL